MCQRQQEYQRGRENAQGANMGHGRARAIPRHNIRLLQRRRRCASRLRHHKRGIVQQPWKAILCRYTSSLELSRQLRTSPLVLRDFSSFRWLKELRDHADDRIVVLVVGNKCDLRRVKWKSLITSPFSASFFLDASSHLSKRVCPSVGPSVRG